MPSWKNISEQHPEQHPKAVTEIHRKQDQPSSAPGSLVLRGGQVLPCNCKFWSKLSHSSTYRSRASEFLSSISRLDNNLSVKSPLTSCPIPNHRRTTWSSPIISPGRSNKTP